MANKIFKSIYYLFLAFVVCVALFLVFSIFPIAGNFKVFVVQSGSMEPTIHTGSVVAVKPEVSYNIGDIVTFGPNTRKQAPTTHRIAEMRLQTGQPVYVTRGDANNGPDAKEITSKDIIGKVVLTVPYVGYAVAAAKTPVGFMVLIVVPAAIIIFDELKKIWKEAVNMRKKKKEEEQKIE